MAVKETVATMTILALLSVRAAALFLATILFLTAASAQKIDLEYLLNKDNYLKEAAERRLHLIRFGNAIYPNMVDENGVQTDSLKGIAKDLELMGARFSSFKGSVIHDPGSFSTVRDFETKLEAMLDGSGDVGNKVIEGDVVVFYYSGHGFSVGETNFLAPTEFNATEFRKIHQQQWVGHAVAVRDALKRIATRKPAVVYVILDACRDSIGWEDANGNVLVRSDNFFKNQSGHLQYQLDSGIKVHFAGMTTLIAQATASNSENEASPFTAILSDVLEDIISTSREPNSSILAEEMNGRSQTVFGNPRLYFEHTDRSRLLAGETFSNMFIASKPEMVAVAEHILRTDPASKFSPSVRKWVRDLDESGLRDELRNAANGISYTGQLLEASWEFASRTNEVAVYLPVSSAGLAVLLPQTQNADANKLVRREDLASYGVFFGETSQSAIQALRQQVTSVASGRQALIVNQLREFADTVIVRNNPAVDLELGGQKLSGNLARYSSIRNPQFSSLPSGNISIEGVLQRGDASLEDLRPTGDSALLPDLGFGDVKVRVELALQTKRNIGERTLGRAADEVFILPRENAPTRIDADSLRATEFLKTPQNVTRVLISTAIIPTAGRFDDSAQIAKAHQTLQVLHAKSILREAGISTDKINVTPELFPSEHTFRNRDGLQKFLLEPLRIRVWKTGGSPAQFAPFTLPAPMPLQR